MDGDRVPVFLLSFIDPFGPALSLSLDGQHIYNSDEKDRREMVSSFSFGAVAQMSNGVLFFLSDFFVFFLFC